MNKPDVIYAGLRGSEVYYGACTASVPEQHGRGRIERPLIPSLANRDDAMLLLDVTPPQDEDWFVTAFNRRIAKSPDRAVFVFVHGYYINFHDAALRTAQIAHDIRFDGVAVSYSWPSADIFFGYLIDADNAEWSIPHFVDFLDVLVDRTDAEEIYILAHSMGTRIVARGLREFARSRAAGDRRVFKEVVFAAADIDSEIFGRDYAPHVVDTAERLTIYMSNADWALGGSRRLHGYDRLGQTSVADESEPWFNRVDLIDATAVDHGIVGHVYYSCSPTVLEDIEQLIAGKSPQERGLKKSKRVNEIEPIDWSARSESSVGDPAIRRPVNRQRGVRRRGHPDRLIVIRSEAQDLASVGVRARILRSLRSLRITPLRFTPGE